MFAKEVIEEPPFNFNIDSMVALVITVTQMEVTNGNQNVDIALLVD